MTLAIGPMACAAGARRRRFCVCGAARRAACVRRAFDARRTRPSRGRAQARLARGGRRRALRLVCGGGRCCERRARRARTRGRRRRSAQAAGAGRGVGSSFAFSGGRRHGRSKEFLRPGGGGRPLMAGEGSPALSMRPVMAPFLATWARLQRWLGLGRRARRRVRRPAFGARRESPWRRARCALWVGARRRRGLGRCRRAFVAAADGAPARRTAVVAAGLVLQR
jgi:hypothetical protein